MNYFLFALYLVILSGLLRKIPFVKGAGIGNNIVLPLFWIKILAGVTIGWVSLHLYSSGNDYWDVNREGWKEYQLLWSDPHRYFTDLFTSDYSKGYGGLFDSFQSFWNDLRNNIVIKMISLFDFFSQGNYYINSLFFNFLCFTGNIAFYRIFIRIYPQRRVAVIICCFLLPSMLYFTSGIQKDGIVFSLLGILCFVTGNILRQNKITARRILLLISCLFLLFLVRSFVFIGLVPAFTAWLISARIQQNRWLVFAGVYVFFALVIFNIGHFFPSLDPLEAIAQKQADFSTLPYSSTKIDITPLIPGIKSFISNAPEALDHSLLRPYITDTQNRMLIPLSVETLLYLCIFVIFLFFHVKQVPSTEAPFITCCVFFALTMLLIIGYIVPNLGSLVRYRSIYLPFLITPLLCGLDSKKALSFFKIKK